MEYSITEIGNLITHIEEKRSHLLSFAELDKLNEPLIKQIIATPTCHIRTVGDILEVLGEILKYQEIHRTRISTINLAKTLSRINPDKYQYQDEIDKFNGLRRITDSDIIDFKSLSEEDYSIIYSILYNDYGIPYTYNAIAHGCNAYTQANIKVISLRHWGRLFKSIIQRIERVLSAMNQTEALVYIPFLDDYSQTASHVIRLYEISLDITEQLSKCATDSKFTLIKTKHSHKPVRSMIQMMESYMSKHGRDSKVINAFNDEMMRRDLIPATKRHDEYCNTYKEYYLTTSEDNYNAEESDIKAIKKSDKVAAFYYILSPYKVKKSHICQAFNLVESGHVKSLDSSDTTYAYLKDPEKLLFRAKTRYEEVKRILEKCKYTKEEIKDILPPNSNS